VLRWNSIADNLLVVAGFSLLLLMQPCCCGFIIQGMIDIAPIIIYTLVNAADCLWNIIVQRQVKVSGFTHTYVLSTVV